jgi:hypothetical protein
MDSHEPSNQTDDDNMIDWKQLSDLVRRYLLKVNFLIVSRALQAKVDSLGYLALSLFTPLLLTQSQCL